MGRPLTEAALRDYFPDGQFANRLQPVPGRGLILVKNAKVATSTLLVWLNRIYTGDHQFVPERSAHHEHQLPSADDVGLDEVARMLSGEAFRFAFVRHPMRRVESAYQHKIMRSTHTDHYRNLIRRALGIKRNGEPVPFGQFVAALEQMEPIEMDPHWRPQHLNLMHPLVEYDHVGRLESFADDLEVIRRRAGLPEVPLEVRNVSPQREESLFVGRPKLRRRVRRLYARDFEIYGY